MSLIMPPPWPAPSADTNLAFYRDRRNWIAVASAEHVRIGRRGGFMQVCHGKAAPLKRLRGGDGVAYYSPTEVFQASQKLQAFTAIGVVRDRDPYRATVSGNFHPYRRDVQWHPAAEAPIRPLATELAFMAKRNWGYQLRFGLFEISAEDMALIAAAMGVLHADGGASDGAGAAADGAAVIA